MRLKHMAGTCEDGPCPNVFNTDEKAKTRTAAVQGAQLTDREALAQLNNMPAHETVVIVPRALLLQYALREILRMLSAPFRFGREA